VPIDTPVEQAPARPPKPPPAFPNQVPLETGLSDYGMWIEMFTDTDIPPLAAGDRRGRIWA
jgi:hypothetical protein